ncbi:MAG: N-acetyltransferase [Clostridia bacterium]|nr:N-acetyltransferase [Clostridia bacterium]
MPTIRNATTADAKALLAIYIPYVENTAVSLELTPPTLAEFTSRMESRIGTYPYLVLEESGEILGYAYAGRFHARAAYDLSAEATIYLRKGAKGRGFGKLLYTALEDELKKRNVQNLYACIAYADPEDEHLQNDSYRFHTAMGYIEVGHFHKCAYKFSRWFDMVWMEKFLGEHEESPKGFIGF